jgi:hypothetical protein
MSTKKAQDVWSFRQLFWLTTIGFGFIVSWLIGVGTLYCIGVVGFYIYDVGLRDKDKKEDVPRCVK